MRQQYSSCLASYPRGPSSSNSRPLWRLLPLPPLLLAAGGRFPAEGLVEEEEEEEGSPLVEGVP